MKYVNYKSDFDFILKLKDARGYDVPFPECDWDADIWTTDRSQAINISRKGNVYNHCSPHPDGGIHVIINSPNMGLGELKWEPHFKLLSDTYPDNTLDIYKPQPLGIRLVSTPFQYSTADVKVLLPYIKGDKGDQGEVGPQGPKGDIGPQGLKGDKGDI